MNYSRYSILWILCLVSNIAICYSTTLIFPGIPFGFLVIIDFVVTTAWLLAILFLENLNKPKPKKYLSGDIFTIHYTNLKPGIVAKVVSDNGESLSDNFNMIERMLASSSIKGLVLLDYSKCIYTNKRLYSIQFDGVKFNMKTFNKYIDKD